MRPRLCRPIHSVALLCILVGAARAGAATQVAQVNANVVKPVAIKWVQDFDLGTIILGTGNWSGATVSLSQAGVLACANANVTCSGATAVAKYNVTGTNNMTVRISAPNVTLTNQADTSKTLILTVSSPASVLLTSSGAPGITFPIGGSITVNSNTPSGLYRGTFNVTADY